MPPVWADKYVGADYRRFNCWQLVCLVFRNEFNIGLPTYEGQYRNECDGRRIARLHRREAILRWRPVERPQLGDVLSLRTLGRPWHVGLVLDQNLMLHTDKGIDATIEKYSGPGWRHRVLGCYRYAG